MPTPIITRRERVGMASALLRERKKGIKKGLFLFFGDTHPKHPISCICVCTVRLWKTYSSFPRESKRPSCDTTHRAQANLAQQKWLRKREKKPLTTKNHREVEALATPKKEKVKRFSLFYIFSGTIVLWMVAHRNFFFFFFW